MEFVEKLDEKLGAYYLLRHPFYQAWNEGVLARGTLCCYAREYYHHVAAFPRYISSIHANCAHIQHRQILLGNLIDEEQGPDNHPELWRCFARGLGVKDEELDAPAPTMEKTRRLVDGYFTLTRVNFFQGLGALYAYERQTAEVSKSKMDGLKKFYGMHDERALRFFSVHADFDPWHTQELVQILSAVSREESQKCEQGALEGAVLLWEFLDGLYEQHCEHSCH